MLRFLYRQVNLTRPAVTLGNAQSRDLPLVTIGIEGPTQTIALRCRIDSGADDSVFPEWLALLIGVDLSAAPLGYSQSTGGVPLTYRCASVTLRLSDGLESCCWDALVGFLPTTSRIGLLGLAGCLDYFDTTLLGRAHEILLAPNAAFPGMHFIHGGGTHPP